MKVSRSYSIDDKYIPKLKKLSDDTRIPQSKYLEEALDYLFKKYKVDLK